MAIRRSKKNLFLSLVMLVVLAACGGGDGGGGGDAGGEAKGELTVGVSGAFAENQIVAEMYAQVLEDAGYTVDRQLDIGSREISQTAFNNGEIDVVPEYLASLLLFLDPDATATGNASENAEKVRTALQGKNAVLLEPSGANDTNAIVVTGETAEERNLEKVSDLAPIAGELRFGGPPECPERPFCIPGLRDTYGITFREFRPLDTGPLTVAALEGGEIDVALLFSTSSVIEDKGWVLLEDDKNLQAAENITPLVRQDVVNDEVTELLNGVSEALTTENITELNARVEIDNEDPADVAQEFLEDEGLL
ncbi:MAG TPA: ABC transporter substrate-binding protein [Actinomycetota bacterium]|nr:ABC transporter substrate-binding protein [Actinomycetota bacterium]